MNGFSYSSATDPQKFWKLANEVDRGSPELLISLQVEPPCTSYHPTFLASADYVGGPSAVLGRRGV